MLSLWTPTPPVPPRPLPLPSHLLLRRLSAPSPAVPAKLTTTSDFPSASVSGTWSGGGSQAYGPLPTPLKITFPVSSGESVLLHACISRVQQQSSNINTNFVIVVDDSTEVAVSNTGNALGWNFVAPAFHGVAEGLTAGSHTAEVKYYTQGGTVYLPHSDPDGPGYLSLTAQAVPATQLATFSHFLDRDSANAWSTSWDSLRWNHPENAKRPATVTFEVVAAGEAVFLTADVSRVTHNSRNDRNTFFRILVDGTTTVAQSNTGQNLNWNYAVVSFHGVAEGYTIPPPSPATLRSQTPPAACSSAILIRDPAAHVPPPFPNLSFRLGSLSLVAASTG